MCESSAVHVAVRLYCNQQLIDAAMMRARAIRYGWQKPQSKWEYHWAKQLTFAEVYGSRPIDMKRIWESYVRNRG